MKISLSNAEAIKVAEGIRKKFKQEFGHEAFITIRGGVVFNKMYTVFLEYLLSNAMAQTKSQTDIITGLLMNSGEDDG